MKVLSKKMVCLIATATLLVGCKPELTKQNAAKIIPDGMPESSVYEILGTNGFVSNGEDHTKYILYFFPFFPPPPKVKTKIAGMTVIVSNGVVVERQFAEVH